MHYGLCRPEPVQREGDPGRGADCERALVEVELGRVVRHDATVPVHRLCLLRRRGSNLV